MCVPYLALRLIWVEIVGPIDLLVATDIAVVRIFGWFVHVRGNGLLFLAEVGQVLLHVPH